MRYVAIFCAPLLLLLVLQLSPTVTLAAQSNTPSDADRVAMLEQIQSLMKLLALLQAQLEARQASQAVSTHNNQPAKLGVFMKNLSNGSFYNMPDGTLGTYYGDRVGLGWTNDRAKNCQVTDHDNELRINEYHGSETDAQLEIIMPTDEAPKVYYLTVRCSVDGQSVFEQTKINHLRALQNQVRVSSGAIRSYGPSQEWYDQTLTPSSKSGLATLNVKHIDKDSYELYGEIRPASNCTEGYLTWFRLDDGTGLHWFLNAPDCKSVTYSESFIYRPIPSVGVANFSPSIALLTYDGRAITQHVQERKNITIDGTGDIQFR